MRHRTAVLAVVLTIAMVTLKLMGLVSWSWWVVLFPLWLPAALLLIVAMIFGIVMMVTWR